MQSWPHALLSFPGQASRSCLDAAFTALILAGGTPVRAQEERDSALVFNAMSLILHAYASQWSVPVGRSR